MTISGLTVDTNTNGRIDLSWTNDTTTDSIVVRRETQLPSGTYTQQVDYADLAGTDTDFFDIGVRGGVTYRYNVVQLDTSGNDVDSVSTTVANTLPSGIHSERTSPKEWRVEIESPNGELLQPSVIGEPEWIPRLSTQPRVKIPVPREQKWDRSEFERAPMRVYYNGSKLPIEELADAKIKPSESVLIGVGGVELLQRVSPDYEQRAAHLAAKDLIEDNTNYAANVDDAQTFTKTDEQLAFYDSESDFLSNVDVDTSDPHLPLDISDTVEAAQTCYFVEGEQFNLSGTLSDADASAGETEAMFGGSGLSSTVTINLDYEIPAGNVGLAFRYDNPNDPDGDSDYEGAGFEVIVDGLIDASPPVDHSKPAGYSWFTDDSAHGVDLPSGNIDITIEIDSIGSNNTNLDAVAIYDSRYSHTFDNTVDSNGYLSGPALYGAGIEVPFETDNSTLNVDAGILETTTTTGTTPAELALSNDDGSTWQTSANTSSFTHDFSGYSLSLKARLSLEGTGTRTTASPTEGFQSQSVDTVEISADLDDTPVVVYQGWDETLLTVLRQIAEQAQSIFELRLNDNGEMQIEWTRYGLREGDAAPPVEDYEVGKSTEDQHQRAVVRGSNSTRYGENFTASYGVTINLDRDDLVNGSEKVQTTDFLTEYERGTDYTIDYETGSITTLASGSMTDGDPHIIDYEFKIIGEYTIDGATAPIRPIIESFPAIRSQTLADQVATLLATDLGNPQWEAEVLISEISPDQSLVVDLDIEDVPTDVRMETREITHTDMGVRLRLGNRGTAAEEIDDIRNTLQSLVRN